MIYKGTDLNELVQGGQLYLAFPFGKTSLAWHKPYAAQWAILNLFLLKSNGETSSP